MAWGKRRPPVADKVQCSEILVNGEQCGAWALRSTHDDEEPKCRVHSLTPEQRSEHSRRMAARSAVARHGDVEAAPRLSGLDPGVTLAELLPLVREALTAVYEYTGEANWNVRLAAVGTLLAAFPREYRRTPEECADLIRRAIPPEIRSPEMEDATTVYEALRKSWDEVDGLAYSELKGLFVRRYPEWCIAPFENRYYIQDRRPKTIPPDKAPVRRHPTDPAKVILEREGKFPLAVPVGDEPDDGSVLVEDDGVNPW